MSIVNDATTSSAGATRVRRPAAETRQLLLDAAEELFYWHGINATGVDRIAAEAGLAPTTLYRLFGSKDALIAAYVDRYAAGYRAWVGSLTSDPEVAPRDRILALFDGLLANTGPEAFRGCPFLMALAECPDPASAAHASAAAVKAWVRSTLLDLARELPAGTQPPEVVADQLALVVEGLYASTAALGTDGPARRARELAALVLDAGAASTA